MYKLIMTWRQEVKKIFTILILLIGITGCGKEKQSSDTILWINGTYAMLTAVNHGDIQKAGGYEKTADNTKVIKKLLVDWWGINNRNDADNTLNWLLEEGHRHEFLAAFGEYKLQNYNRESFNKIITTVPKSDRPYFTLLFDSYEKYGTDAITAWDLCRALQLLGFYYIAGYYTYEESLDKSLEIAKQIQGIYSSWDDMCQSYLYGYQYWNDDDINDKESATYSRTQVYKKVKNMKNSPYNLRWDTELKKEW